MAPRKRIHSLKLAIKSQDRIIYQISVADVQEVAEQELERKLTKKETDQVERRLGDFIDWYDALVSTLQDLNIE